MGHRHMLNAPQIPEASGDQGWNHTDQPYKPIARHGPFESSSLVHPVENMAVQGGPFLSSTSSSSGFSSSILNAELTHHQPEAPGPSRDPLPHQPAAGNFHSVPDNNLHHPSSSRPSGQTVPRVDDDFHNRTVGRGPYKRKSPCVYDDGSSSNTGLYHTPWNYPSGNRDNNSLSISGESIPRNVRTRFGAGLEPNPFRAFSPSSFMHHHPFSSPSSDQINSVDFSRWSSNTRKMERNGLISSAGHGVTIGSGSSFFSHYPNTMNALNSHSDGSSLSGNIIIPQNANCDVNQCVGGIQSGYDQRSAPTFRASSSNSQAGQVAVSDERLQMAAESYPSRHRRTVSTIRFHNSARNGRTGISSGRFRSFTEGLMAVDRAALYGSRNPFDQHRNMRLDVDNMSYEELLVLGETIGSVSTGLSDSLISKCLTESIFCSSDLVEDDGRCVICLEEYKHMDDVGNLKCGHDFHVCCIRKWLSMKNLCPICKSSAMNESNKEK